MRGIRALLPGAIVLAVLLVSSASAERSASLRVVFLTENTGCAGAFMQNVCSAFIDAVGVTDVEGRILTPTLREDPLNTLELLAKQDYGLVTAFGAQYPWTMSEVAPRYPEKRFVLMDRSYAETRGRPRNVQGTVFRTSEAAYLAGWLAARMEQRRARPHVLGVVAGIGIPPVNDFVIGFRAGARRAVPGITVLVGYSENFVDPLKCAPIARLQAAQGAGVLFNVAGVCGLAALDVARERGLWGIGVDTDQSQLGPHVLTSVLKNFRVGFLAVLRAEKAGRLETGGDTVLGLREGAVALGKVSSRVPPAMRTELERVSRRIAAGEIRVPGAYPSRR